MSLVTHPELFFKSGAYAIVGKSGTIAAGASAGSPVFTFLWQSTTANAKAAIDRIHVSIASLGTGFAAGVGYVDAIVGRSFSAADTGGKALTITGDNAKRRTGMPTTGVTEIRMADTGVLSAGTRTLDDQPFAAVQFAVSTATNTVHLPTADIWRPNPRTYPLVLTASEGIVLRATVPATGTWQLVVGVEWREVLG